MTLEAPTEEQLKTAEKPIEDRESITIRFAGDSGDGMQLTGTQFTNTSAIFGNDVCTLPDFPAEIRAPAGTVYGVSGFQVHFSSHDIHTPGDQLDALVVMNPAALKVNLGDLDEGGIILANSDGFNDSTLKLAGYESNPLEDGSLSRYKVFRIPITSQNRTALEEFEMKTRDTDRCKNFYALGIVCWLFNRPLEPIVKWLSIKFKGKDKIIAANSKSLKSGYYYGETAEIFTHSFQVRPATLPPGEYREVMGNEALALGLVAAGHLAKKTVVYASYPITPASDILHEMSRHKNFDVRTFQAEDEIAAMTAVIGAAYGGALAVTGTSGPGLALKSEAIALGVMTELPMIIVDVQRGGPSTGLPTKTEAADLLQSMYGRNGECPVAIVAPGTPSECFSLAIEAARIAFRHMVPVIFLSDGYLGNGAEPWRIPSVDSLEPIEVKHPDENTENFQPYRRDKNLARPWALPGTKNLVHRLGGLEKADVTGNVSYDPENHQHMVDTRQAKIDAIAKYLPPLQVHGDEEGDLLVLGWGSTQGSILQATNRARKRGLKVSCAQLKYLNPFAPNLADVLGRFKRVLIPELNKGQLLMMIRSRFLIDAIGLNKVKGRPFTVSEILLKIEEILSDNDN